jgi:hypothetical protein
MRCKDPRVLILVNRLRFAALLPCKPAPMNLDAGRSQIHNRIQSYIHSRLRSYIRRILTVILLSLVPQLPILASTDATTGGSSQTSATVVVPAITQAELVEAVTVSISKVEEFRFIREEAKRLGIKVYLFGGTAAAFGHYVRWDLLRQKGDPRFHPARFDYKYINIYRSTQDLDIVVDGPTNALTTLAKAIVENFPYLQGSKGLKQAWEVRSLREDMGDKLALLNNPDFLNQHTDSQSVGLIELTDPQNPNERIRDLRDWNNIATSGFLRDMLEGKIHYYFSQKHGSTNFAKEGRNPPILSAIRYFIKVVQLDLEMRPEDVGVLKQIISDFNPAAIEKHDYLPHWFEDNAPKLIQNAIDVQTAMKLIDEVGLRGKLKKIGEIGTVGSVAWWIGKQPLVSKPLGKGFGQTAAELGIDVVAHETTSFLVYEAITRSHKLIPNVLISRDNYPGEVAAHGDGFYAMIGDRSGFRGTGFTIRFHVKPDARDKSDFDIQGNIIIVHNRDAIEVIPENLTMNLIDYYSWLQSVDEISKDDLGIFHRLRLSMRANFAHPSEKELNFVNSLSWDELNDLFMKDPSFDSKKLLIAHIALRLNDFGKVVDLLQRLKNTEKGMSVAEAEALRETVLRDYGERFRKMAVNQPLSENNAIRAFEFGVFKGHEDIFLQKMEPHLKSASAIIALWKKWHRINPDFFEDIQSFRNSPLLWQKVSRLAKMFFSFQPTSDQVRELEHLPPIILMGLGAKKSSDPLVMMQSLMAGTGPIQGPAFRSLNKELRSIWKHRKGFFFELKPSQNEILKILPIVNDQLILGDLIEYCFSHLSWRRLAEWRDLLLSLPAPTVLTEGESTARISSLVDQIVEEFINKSPGVEDLAKALNVEILSAKSQKNLKSALLEHLNTFQDVIDAAKIIRNKTELESELLAHREIFNGFAYSHQSVDEYGLVTNYGESSFLAFVEYIKQNPNDVEYPLVFLSENKRRYDVDGLEVVEASWLKGVKGYIRENQKNLHNIAGLKRSAPSLKAYRDYLPMALNVARSLAEFIQLLNDWDWYLEENFVSQKKQIEEIHMEILPIALGQMLVKHYSGTGSFIPASDFSFFMQEITVPSVALRMVDNFISSGSLSVYDGGSVKLGRETRVSKDVQAQFQDGVALYEIIHRNKIAKLVSWDQSLTMSVIKNLIQKDRVERLGLATEKEFILMVQKYYTLMNLKMAMNSMPIKDRSQKVAGVLVDIQVWPQNIDRGLLAFDDEIEKQFATIIEKYKNLEVSVWGESGHSIRRAWSKVVGAQDPDNIEKVLDAEISHVDQMIERFVKAHPHLNHQLDHLMKPNAVMTCRRAIE